MAHIGFCFVEYDDTCHDCPSEEACLEMAKGEIFTSKITVKADVVKCSECPIDHTSLIDPLRCPICGDRRSLNKGKTMKNLLKEIISDLFWLGLTMAVVIGAAFAFVINIK